MSNSVAHDRNPYTPLAPLLRRIKRLDDRMKLISMRQPTDFDWATIGRTILPLIPEPSSRDIEILTHLHAASVARTWIEHHALLLHRTRGMPRSQAQLQAMLSQDYRAWLVAKAGWSSYDIDFYDESASYLSTLEKIEMAAERWIGWGAVWVPADTHEVWSALWENPERGDLLPRSIDIGPDGYVSLIRLTRHT